MKMIRRYQFLTAVLLLAGTCCSPASAEEGYSTLTGKFVLDGEIPKADFLIKAGKLSGGDAAKNPEVCAVKDLLSEALVVDAKTKGIGHIFIYIRTAPEKIHPSLVKPPAAPLDFDQIGCRFVPHSLIVRTGQTVRVLSDDACSHNFHTYPLRNEAENFTVTPKFRTGVPLKHEQPELLPMKVTCDIHPWMKAHWLILDHPYAAVTVAEVKSGTDTSAIGTFQIDKLPYGKYEFRVWHEKAGYIDAGSKRGFEVMVDKAKVELSPFKVPAKTFD